MHCWKRTKIDGASEYRIFWSIVMPNVKPAWITLIILLFQMLWGSDGNGYIYSEASRPCIMRQVRLFRAEYPGQERVPR